MACPSGHHHVARIAIQEGAFLSVAHMRGVLGEREKGYGRVAAVIRC